MKANFEQEIYVPLENSERVFKINAEISYSIERNYGADMDGNRGVKKAFIDNISFLSIFEKLNNELIKREEKELPTNITDYIEDYIIDVFEI